MEDEIINIRTVAELLGYKNRRSAIRWCINNGVEILNYHGSKRKYVLAKQFEWIRYQKIFNKIKKRNPDII